MNMLRSIMLHGAATMIARQAPEDQSAAADGSEQPVGVEAQPETEQSAADPQNPNPSMSDESTTLAEVVATHEAEIGDLQTRLARVEGKLKHF